MEKKLFLFACFLFLISRIPFINPQPVFFDSAGYLKAFSYPNLFDAVVAVHFPLHDAYILLFWPFYHAAVLLHLNPSYIVILAQVVLGLVTVIFFYNIITFLTNKRTALIAAIIISLSPLFWISNVTILYEISYIGLFISSLFFLVQFIKRKKMYFIHLSALTLTFAIFTHMMVILWLPLYFAIVFLRCRKQFVKILIIVVSYLLILSYLRTFIISIFADIKLIYVFNDFSLGTFNSAGFGLKGILVSIRNFFIPLMRGYTSLITLLAFISLAILLLKKRYSILLYGILWIGPALIALQFWEAQLPGRYGILAGFGLAFIAAYFIYQNRMLTILVIGYMFIVTLPAMFLLRQETPYMQLANYTATLPEKSLLIESHFSRRQVQDEYKGNLLSINEPNISLVTIKKEIDSHLYAQKPVYVSSAALTDPYGLYAGPYLHALTLSYAKPPELKSLLENYTLKEYKVINADDGLVMYQVISNKKHIYPQIKNLKYHTRRIDYYDPLLKLYQWLTHYIPYGKIGN